MKKTWKSTIPYLIDFEPFELINQLITKVRSKRAVFLKKAYLPMNGLDEPVVDVKSCFHLVKT